MGSIMMSSPMIQVLRTRYPESRIDLLTFAGNAELAEHLDLFDNIMSLRTSSFWSFVRDFFRVMAVMIRTRYDVVFDLEFFSRFSTIVSYLSGARIRVGYYLPKIWRGRFLTHQIHFNPFRHVTEILAAQLEPFGMQVNEYSLKSPRLDVACRARVQSVLADCGWREGTTLVLVNPNASDLCEERKWPRENFVALLEGMCRDHPGFFFALLGSRGERAYVESIHQQLPENVRGRVLCLSGELTIGELIALFSLSRLLITNDSGPLHIAAARHRAFSHS